MKKQGISLITLILSCTIMLTLIITILIILMNNFWFYSEDEYNECEDLEKNIIVVKNGYNEIEVGSVINYMPEGVGPTNYTGGWKLLGKDEQGRLLLLSNESITGEELWLGDYEDFLNVIKILNDICEEYIDGTIGISARSINLNDIEQIIDYDKTEFNSDSASFIDRYSNEVTYSWNETEYPSYSYNYNEQLIENKMKESHKNGFTYYDIAEGGLELEVLPESGIKKSEYAESSNEKIVTLKSNYYRYFQTCLNSLAEKMLFENTEKGNESYWVANRYIATGNYCAFFGINLVEYRELTGYSVFRTYETIDQSYYVGKGVRAVVTLNENIVLEENKDNLGTYDIIY